jgi:hypothetical protein
LARVPIPPRAGCGVAPRGAPCDLTGFELLDAWSISGILSGIAVVGYGNALHRARVAKAIAEIPFVGVASDF